MKNKLLCNDGIMYSEYKFFEDVVLISQNRCDGTEEAYVNIEVDHLRRIILDYDLNYGDEDAE